MSFLVGFLGVVLGIFFLLFLLYLFFVDKLHQMGFHGFSFRKLKKEIEENYSQRPKQVSGMTPLLLPKIEKDFPDFNLEEIYLLTEKAIREILNAIETKDTSLFRDVDFNLIGKKLKLQLEDLINSDILYKYDDIIFHKHAICGYERKDGIATIEISSSLEYCYEKRKNEKIFFSSKRKQQVRYLTKFVYIADRSSYESDMNVYGLNCPNCGAVITGLNAKSCRYCKSGIHIQVVDLLKCWKLIDCKENK